MTATTQQIQEIEGHLVALGMLPANRANAGQADAEFLRALDMGVRVLAGAMEMPGVSGYTPEFGQNLVARIEGMSADDLSEVRGILAENANIDLTPRWNSGLVARELHSRLSSAGVPRDVWGDIRLGALLPMLEDAGGIVSTIDAITTDDDVAQTRVVAQQAAQDAVQTAQGTVLDTLGRPGQSFAALPVQTALRDYVTQLQTDFEFPEAQRYGAFSQEFSLHLSQILNTPNVTLPSGYDATSLQNFANAMDTLRQNSIYTEPEAPMDAAAASQLIEEVLVELAPQLNARLEEAQGRTADQLNDIPEGFLRDMAAVFMDLSGGDLLELRIPEISEADGVFDWRSQASLQGLLMVLGHPQAMNFRGVPTLSEQEIWQYTPAKGRYILDNLDGDEENPGLRQRLAAIMTEEQLAEIEPLLERENVAQLIEALDHLYDEGLISNLYLFDNNFDAPAYMQSLFQDRIDEYQPLQADGEPRNIHMLKLMDSLTREYAGPNMTMQFLMPELEMGDLQLVLPENQEEHVRQMAEFYRDARRRHEASGQGDFTADMMIMLNTVITLPFGEGDYRRGFNSTVEDAIRAAAEQEDIDAAARIFAQRVTEGAQELRDEHGQPYYVRYNEREVPVWRPGLVNMDPIVSGGEQFTVQQIAQAYDDYHLRYADESFQRQGVSSPIDFHGSNIFRDDSGQVWVMAVDRQSMVFSIERLDVDNLVHLVQRMEELQPGSVENLTEGQVDEILQDVERMTGDSGLVRRIEALVEQDRHIGADIFGEALRATGDPGYRMVDQREGGGPLLALSVADFLNTAMSEDLLGFNEFAQMHGEVADVIRQSNAERVREETTRPVPFIAENIAGANDPPELTREESLANPQPLVQANSQDIANLHAIRELTSQYIYGRPLLLTPGARGHDGVIELLRTHEGELQIDSGTQGSMPISEIEFSADDHTGPLMVWYDLQHDKLEVIPAPAELLSAQGRDELRQLSYIQTTLDPQHFLSEMLERPQIYEMVRDQQRASGEAVLNRSAREPLSPTDMREYQLALHNILLQVERAIDSPPDLGRYRYREGGSLTGEFRGRVDGDTSVSDAIGADGVQLRQQWDQGTTPPLPAREVYTDNADDMLERSSPSGAVPEPGSDPDAPLREDNTPE